MLDVIVKVSKTTAPAWVKNLECQLFKGELTYDNLSFVYPGQPRAGHIPWFWAGFLGCPGGVWAVLAPSSVWEGRVVAVP